MSDPKWTTSRLSFYLYASTLFLQISNPITPNPAYPLTAKYAWLFCHWPAGIRCLQEAFGERGGKTHVERQPSTTSLVLVATALAISSPRPSKAGTVRSDLGHLPKIHRCPQNNASFQILCVCEKAPVCPTLSFLGFSLAQAAQGLTTLL